MDIGTATYAETTLASLSVLTLVVAFATSRRGRRMTASHTISDVRVNTLGKVRLLEQRAADLMRQVEELERQREGLLQDIGADDVLGLRSAHAGRHLRADMSLIKLDEVKADA